MSDTAGLTASWFANVLYFFLLVAAIATFFANRRSAQASEESAKASTRLYELQQREYEAREAERRPNLQLFDVFSETDSRTESKAPWYMPLNVYLMNFGERPATIHSATVEFGNAKQDADIRTGACVRHHESAHIKIKMEGDFKKAIHDCIERASTEFNWLQQELTVTVVYSETDGSGVRSAIFKTRYTQPRWSVEHGPVTLAVLRDGEGEKAGDKRWGRRNGVGA